MRMEHRDLHPAALEPDEILKQCDVRRSRASGPGGQNRNKVETAITLTHRPTSITGSATERRSQSENQRIALFRLRVNLALQIRCSIDAQAGPSELWRTRSKGGRIALNPSHDDFPSMLAQAMDAIAALNWDMARAAAFLAVSSSQLVKLLKDEPRALQQVNQQREASGQSRLR